MQPWGIACTPLALKLPHLPRSAIRNERVTEWQDYRPSEDPGAASNRAPTGHDRAEQRHDLAGATDVRRAASSSRPGGSPHASYREGAPTLRGCLALSIPVPVLPQAQARNRPRSASIYATIPFRAPHGDLIRSEPPWTDSLRWSFQAGQMAAGALRNPTGRRELSDVREKNLYCKFPEVEMDG
jgi:hypothetical protein